MCIRDRGVYDHIVDAGDVTSFTVKDLVSFTTYYFVVSAYNPAGDYDSNEISVTLEGTLAQPRIIVLSGTNIIPTGGHGTGVISWEAVSGATGYRIDLYTDNTAPGDRCV